MSSTFVYICFILFIYFSCSLSQWLRQQANSHEDVEFLLLLFADALLDSTTEHRGSAAHMGGAESSHLGCMGEQTGGGEEGKGLAQRPTVGSLVGGGIYGCFTFPTQILLQR